MRGGGRLAGSVLAGTLPVLNCCITGISVFSFYRYVSYWTVYLCAVSCFKRYSQFFIFREMYKTIVFVYLKASQQKCSSLQDIPKHAIYYLAGLQYKGDNLIV